ncbi:MAG TPA: transcription termination/antitermination protein NusG [Candidatus Aphodomonas merdavium]|nr:transcription termination/antitermination protein NusG [Candidatus Aphodomonas merdavium]
MADHGESNGLQWYVAHTYSGYENKVKANLEKAVENNGMQDLIKEIRVPVEEVVEIKNGKRRTVQRKVFPGYVLVQMIMTDETWYVVRNTRGVTGFVGPGSKPIPLTEEEVETMGMECRSMRIDIALGEEVRILSGPLEDFVGRVEEIDTLHQTVRVVVSMFGRETPVELEFSQIKREK